MTLLDIRRFVDSTTAAAFDLTSKAFASDHPVRWSGLATGMAGVALFFLELHRLQGDPRAMERSLMWLKAAEEGHEAEWRAETWKEARFGLAFGRAGIAYARAAVANELADEPATRVAIDELDASWRQVSMLGDQLDAYIASPGILWAARDLVARGVDCDPIHRIVRESGERVTGELVSSEALRSGAPLGVAHGLAGALFAVLGGGGAGPEVRATLDRLIGEAHEGDGLVLWPRRIGEEVPGELAETWCNGIAGFGILLAQAAAIHPEGRYTELARMAADTLQLMRTDHASVCCGSAGQAIALFRTGIGENAARQRRRGLARLRQAIQSSEGDPLNLMQGRLGVALVGLRVLKRQMPRAPLLDFLV